MITHNRDKPHRCKLENEHLRLETGCDLKCSTRYVTSFGIAVAEKGSPAAGRWGWITYLKVNTQLDSPPLWQEFPRQP